VTVTFASLTARFPEFANTESAVVTAAIAEATEECDERVFGDSYDHAVALLAAHKLSVSPYGQQARLKADADGRTTYLAEWERLARRRAGGPTVITWRPA
jgi:hypothetical protein